LIKDAESSLADTTISCDPPTADEVAKAIHRLKSGKAPDICGISAELLKAGDNVVVKWLSAVIRGVWETGRIPPHRRKGIILPLYKVKVVGECKNYRGITPLPSQGRRLLLPCCLASRPSCWDPDMLNRVASHLASQL